MGYALGCMVWMFISCCVLVLCDESKDRNALVRIKHMILRRMRLSRDTIEMADFRGDCRGLVSDIELEGSRGERET